ncbi:MULTISPECIES: hypothetical protein [Bradyrhizobium]|jgi:hypothetical protein|uniref:Uncharacterized protein n=1 Tax=Bradyrhizobium elkanii TaxID=29448 RepID=A0A8I2C401_BRAEL|nr:MULTISPECIES: hypothetical protein [Bradyrhizobium]MBP1297095.1 hypothetical protein [Bradyrhizobium elkanii]MCP1932143.1 hypothetical protein [Bradyrhizobium elkanii]MCS3577315.1 hypothetical protein [Bradyrhizobium elkanii]MCS3720191.1 hypothetical protein [Bradyrhizobium elkanii]MCS3881141.1 hypothetical protein [Bradyrhizobium elkanii]
MKLLQLALAGVLMLCALAPASARDVPVQVESGRNVTFITDDPGGLIVDFVKKYSDMRDARTKVVLTGECVSACTLMLSILRPELVCAMPEAALGFHSASTITKEPGKPDVIEHAPEISLLVFNSYPAKVRSFLEARGWRGANAHPDIIWVRGKNLRKMIRPCTEADMS